MPPWQSPTMGQLTRATRLKPAQLPKASPPGICRKSLVTEQHCGQWGQRLRTCCPSPGQHQLRRSGTMQPNAQSTLSVPGSPSRQGSPLPTRVCTCRGLGAGPRQKGPKERGDGQAQHRARESTHHSPHSVAPGISLKPFPPALEFHVGQLTVPTQKPLSAKGWTRGCCFPGARRPVTEQQGCRAGRQITGP